MPEYKNNETATTIYAMQHNKWNQKQCTVYTIHMQNMPELHLIRWTMK